MRAVSAALLACALHTAAARPACPAEPWPARMRLDYDVTASRGLLAIDGTGVLRFERSGSRYTLSSDLEAVGLYHARQVSSGTIDVNGLRPDEYVETRGSRKPRVTRFDWSAKRVEFPAAPQTPGSAVAGMQDRISLVLQLGWRRSRQPDAAGYEMLVAGSRRAAPLRFERGALQTLQLPAGAIEAVALTRPGDDEHDRIEIWYAPAWCGLPVRMRYTDRRGGSIDHRLRAAQIE